MLGLVWLSACVASAPIGESSFAVAQRLYDAARYEEALAALGGDCAEAERVACERLRAFIAVAIGDTAAATSAFERLIIADHDATLGPDAPPKIVSLFAEAKRRVAALGETRLDVSREGSELLLEVELEIDLDGVVAYVGTDDEDVFSPAELARQGQIWQGRVDADRPSRHLAYYLKLALPGGVALWVGKREAPRFVDVLESSGGVRSGRGEASADSRARGPREHEPIAEQAAGGDKAGGLPRWAFWTLIGGGGALVLGGIILAVALSQSEDPPGTIRVGIAFEGEP